MRILLQRVSGASVSVRQHDSSSYQEVASIRRGVVLLVGFRREDTEEAFQKSIEKISQLRIFPATDPKGSHFDRTLLEEEGEVLLVSQFTLYGSCLKGRRPDFFEAMPPNEALSLYEKYVQCWQERFSGKVGTGVFGADMQVSLCNDGPVTFLLEW